MGVYYILNTVNGKRYIGQSKCVEDRINEHFYRLKLQERYHEFQEDYNKYGRSAFDSGLLKKCSTREECWEWEKYYIKYYDSMNNGYNRC